MKLSGVLFDFDGTIINNERYHMESVRVVLKSAVGKNYSDKELAPFAGLPYLDRIIQLLAKHNIHDSAFATILERDARAYYQTIYSIEESIVPGAVDFFKLLHQQHITLAVVTSALHDYTVKHLEQAHIDHYFSSVTGRDDVARKKPDPLPYLQSARQHHLATDSVIVFEDSPVGMQAARSAGFPVIGVLTNFSKDELPHAAITISDYTEMTLDTLEKLL